MAAEGKAIGTDSRGNLAAGARCYAADAGDPAGTDEAEAKIHVTPQMSVPAPFPIPLGARVKLLMDGKEHMLTVVDVIRV